MTIRLKFLRSYKCIKEFSDIKLPDMTVITGINGSGKTHFLSAIENKDVEVTSENNVTLKNVKYINHQSLLAIVSHLYEPGQKQQRINDVMKHYKSFKSRTKIHPHLKLQHVIKDTKTCQHIEYTAKKAEVDILKLDDKHFQNYYPPATIMSTDLTENNLSEIFKVYQILQDKNEYAAHRNKKCPNNKKPYDYIDQNEFIKQHGPPPWEIVNQILSKFNMGYTITDPIDSDRDASFTARLLNSDNDIIEFNELSSGEKTLLTLVVSLYNVQDDMPGTSFPEIILLDEPDASLHPSMIYDFLHIVDEIFIKQHKMKIIIATHSPSTVALSDESSLYVMANSSGHSLKKTTKDEALSALTFGVPYVSVSYNHRRQIFVESKQDAFIYETIHQKLRRRLESKEVSLSFISVGTNNKTNGCDIGSGCLQVKHIASSLFKNGAENVFGIIDWDLQNGEDGNIKILGQGKRYAIENYMLDPIVLSIYLAHANIKHDMLKLQKHADVPEVQAVLNYDSLSLQEVVDNIVECIENSPKFSLDNTKSDKITCEYVNGKSVEIPKWYLECKGKDLLDAIIEIFPATKQKAGAHGQQQGKLLEEILHMLCNNYSDLIPMDFLKLFNSIVNTVKIEYDNASNHVINDYNNEEDMVNMSKESACYS